MLVKQEDEPLDEFTKSIRSVITGGMHGKPKHELIIEMGNTPDLLKQHGFPDLPLIIKGKTVDKICFDHGIGTDLIENLPGLILTATHLFSSASAHAPRGSVVVITVERKLGGAPVVIAVHQDKKVGRSRRVNEVVSMYAKEGPDPIAKWSKDGLLLWERT